MVAVIFISLALSAELKAGPGDGDVMPPQKCSASASDYYTIDLVTTKNVKGTGLANGKAVMKFNPNPFGISITQDGSYRHRLDIKLHKVNKPETGTFVAWVTTPSLDKVKLLGSLNEMLETSGTVEWNKYIVVITLEEAVPKSNTAMWEGPIAFRGLSRSGLMHTLAGHGPFAQEPCADIINA